VPVRDLLLGVPPERLPTSRPDARPDRIMDLFPNSRPRGRAFGVVLGAQRCRAGEVATFAATRKLTGGVPTRCTSRPIPPGTRQRRDFTVNGLMMDPDSGEVLDVSAGAVDLERGEIRAIGDPKRDREDHLASAARRSLCRAPEVSNLSRRRCGHPRATTRPS